MSNRKYSAEFKAEAVYQVIERGYSAREISERIGVSLKSFYVWINAWIKQDIEAEAARLMVLN